ncbi:aminocarboxymuconate-semialdehyde decarboxylase [Cupriavidus sp. UYMMa02A]|nr:aminocarboxymuconate-semialdehyde decarboxylase [Cupriavidus sp. UYMMa02A]
MSAAACSCGLVDVHTHWVPDRFPTYLGSRKGVSWPSIAPATSACQYHVMIEGKVYRTIPDACWDLSRREQDMAAVGVAQQVLSPMPELLSYWLELDDAQALIGFLNDELAALVRGRDDRFTALGAVPLQDVDAAIRELERVVRVLGLPGVEIGSNINGLPLGHPTFAPFFEAAEALGAAVFVHALRPCGMDRLVGPPLLEQVLAFPGEVGLAAASLLTSGTLMRYPRLRIAFSHGGGSLPSLLPRLQHAWETMPTIRETMVRAPGEMARALYVDNLVYDSHTIANLLHCYGATQVMVGTDYPFAIMDRFPDERINGLAIPAQTRRLLARGNALRWLGEGGQAEA